MIYQMIYQMKNKAINQPYQIEILKSNHPIR